MANIIFKERLKGTCIVPVGLAMVLVPYSLLIGWNVITLFLFWFALIPTLAVYLPPLISKNKNHLFESVSGLTIFYGIMVFMIYDHYQSDYFQVMVFSALINMGLVTGINLLRAKGIQSS